MSNFYKNARVLVAGGTGTIGIPLVRRLKELGALVRVVSLDNEELASSILGDDVEFIREDLRNDRNCVFACRDIDYVFDMVGIKGSTKTNTRNHSKLYVNFTRFQTNLMDAASKMDIKRYLYVGSVCSYPPMDTPKQENDMWKALPRQNDKYAGLVKRMGEMQAQAYLEEGSWDGVRIIRPSNVYGPFDDFNPETAQVIGSLVYQGVNNETIKLVDDGTSFRDFIFSDDIAFWAAEALEKLSPCDPVNISSGHGISIREVANIVSSLTGKEVELGDNTFQGDKVRILSTIKAQSLLGYTQKTSIKHGIEKTIEWYKNNKDIASKKGKFYE